ncbi:ELAV-like protein 3 [Convolutriloba macropyga]|uniref:ELAV-like protein 3 n=1 Tax=Convolutriloba macropyga TaxID=536237 RepID=UPI003F523804
MTDPNIYLASLNTANLFLMSGLLDNPAGAAACASPVNSGALGSNPGGTLGNAFSLSDALKMSGNKTSPLGSEFSNALSNFGSGLGGGRVMTPNKADMNQNLGLSLNNCSFANTLSDVTNNHHHHNHSSSLLGAMGTNITNNNNNNINNNSLTSLYSVGLGGPAPQPKDEFGSSSSPNSNHQMNGSALDLSSALGVHDSQSSGLSNGNGSCLDLSGGVLPQPLPNESSTNLITNYLPPSMKQEEVRVLFSAIGEVESCKLVRDKITGQSLCYAFINFKDPHDASIAVDRLNGIVVGNKKIKVSFARPSSPSIKDANLYISGIPKDVTAGDLEELFSEVGSIITSRILTDPTTGQSRGVGFIRFDHRRDAERAIQRFDGYQFVSRNPTSLGSPGGGAGGMAAMGEKLTVKFANTPSHHSQKALQQAYLTASQRRLAASPLAFATAAGPSLHPSIKSLRFSPLGSSSPLGAGNELSSALAGIPALSALSAAAPNPATPTHPFSPLGATPLSTSATSGPGYCLFVYNLASDCEEKEIWQLFGPLGAVKSVKLVYDENKKCKGFGFVTMAHYDESLHAINTLNGAPYNNRILQVSFKSSVPASSSSNSSVASSVNKRS